MMILQNIGAVVFPTGMTMNLYTQILLISYLETLLLLSAACEAGH